MKKYSVRGLYLDKKARRLVPNRLPTILWAKNKRAATASSRKAGHSLISRVTAMGGALSRDDVKAINARYRKIEPVVA